MNARVKELWLKALKSGEYRQGRGTLHDVAVGDSIPETFCCLGVLCDLYRKEHPEARFAIAPNSPQTVFFDYNEEVSDLDSESNTHYLTMKVLKWAGLPTESEDSRDPIGLAKLNDGGISFEDIAKVIEENL